MATTYRALPETLQPRCRPAESDLPRLGVVALATDLTFERDAARLIGWDEAVLHVSRIRFENPTTEENLAAMGPGLADAADLLVPGAKLAALAFACTAASVTIRNEAVRDAIASVRPGVPVVTPSSAALAAMQALGARSIALLTPYLPETTAPMVEYFDSKGVRVIRAACFGLADDRDMARLERTSIVEAATSLDNEEVDALFLSCTAMPSLDVIDTIESRVGKPVVSSNQAVCWIMRSLAALPMRPPRTGGVGRLFDLPGPERVDT